MENSKNLIFEISSKIDNRAKRWLASVPHDSKESLLSAQQLKTVFKNASSLVSQDNIAKHSFTADVQGAVDHLASDIAGLYEKAHKQGISGTESPPRIVFEQGSQRASPSTITIDVKNRQNGENRHVIVFGAPSLSPRITINYINQTRGQSAQDFKETTRGTYFCDEGFSPSALRLAKQRIIDMVTDAVTGGAPDELQPEIEQLAQKLVTAGIAHTAQGSTPEMEQDDAPASFEDLTKKMERLASALQWDVDFLYKNKEKDSSGSNPLPLQVKFSRHESNENAFEVCVQPSMTGRNRESQFFRIECEQSSSSSGIAISRQFNFVDIDESRTKDLAEAESFIAANLHYVIRDNLPGALQEYIEAPKKNTSPPEQKTGMNLDM